MQAGTLPVSFLLVRGTCTATLSLFCQALFILEITIHLCQCCRTYTAYASMLGCNHAAQVAWHGLMYAAESIMHAHAHGPCSALHTGMQCALVHGAAGHPEGSCSSASTAYSTCVRHRLCRTVHSGFHRVHTVCLQRPLCLCGAEGTGTPFPWSRMGPATCSVSRV